MTSVFLTYAAPSRSASVTAVDCRFADTALAAKSSVDHEFTVWPRSQPKLSRFGNRG